MTSREYLAVSSNDDHDPLFDDEVGNSRTLPDEYRAPITNADWLNEADEKILSNMTVHEDGVYYEDGEPEVAGPPPAWRFRRKYLSNMISLLLCVFVFFGCFLFIPRSPYINIVSTEWTGSAETSFSIKQTFKLINRNVYMQELRNFHTTMKYVVPSTRQVIQATGNSSETHMEFMIPRGSNRVIIMTFFFDATAPQVEDAFNDCHGEGMVIDTVGGVEMVTNGDRYTDINLGKLPMRLFCDPTTLYGEDERWGKGEDGESIEEGGGSDGSGGGNGGGEGWMDGVKDAWYHLSTYAVGLRAATENR